MAPLADELRAVGAGVVHLASDLAEPAGPLVASKGALHQLTASLANHLAGRRITVNCVNPGPTDTGYLDREATASMLSHFPAGRWGSPEDAARLVAWLLSDDARWITGEVLNSEGGFRR